MNEKELCDTLKFCAACRTSNESRAMVFGERNVVCPRGWTLERLPTRDAILHAEEVKKFKANYVPCCVDKDTKSKSAKKVTLQKQRQCDSLTQCEKCCNDIKFRIRLIGSTKCPRAFTHVNLPTLAQQREAIRNL